MHIQGVHTLGHFSMTFDQPGIISLSFSLSMDTLIYVPLGLSELRCCLTSIGIPIIKMVVCYQYRVSHCKDETFVCHQYRVSHYKDETVVCYQYRVPIIKMRRLCVTSIGFPIIKMRQLCATSIGFPIIKMRQLCATSIGFPIIKMRQLCVTSIGFPIIKMRWSWDHLISIMGILISVRCQLYIELS